MGWVKCTSDIRKVIVDGKHWWAVVLEAETALFENKKEAEEFLFQQTTTVQLGKPKKTINS